MTTILGNINLPLLSIPAFYILSGIPHGYAVSLGVKGKLKDHDNRNPRSTRHLDSVKRRLTNAEYARWERAEACHRNHLENMPLFVATVFAGLFAEQIVGEGAVGLNDFVVGWMAIRVLYTINYITAETMQWSYLRSLLYFVSTGWAFYTIGRSAMIVGS